MLDVEIGSLQKRPRWRRTLKHFLAVSGHLLLIQIVVESRMMRYGVNVLWVLYTEALRLRLLRTVLEQRLRVLLSDNPALVGQAPPGCNWT